MPSHVPAELKLDEPVYEEDICDVSPYAVLPLSTTSTTINSSLGGYSPRSIQLEDDVPMSGHDMYHMLLRTPKRGLFGSLPSSSLQTHDKQPLKLQMELDSLGVDPVAIAKMQRWVLGIAVVEFDTDAGPTINGLYPPLTLHPAESETLSFCAFPDSVQFDQGSQSHSFRIRVQSSPACQDRPLAKDGFIYGFSHFVQRRDASSKRGYQQRSLVLLTQHQFPALFSRVINHFGPLFEEHGTPMLEAAFQNMATWPDPTPSGILELGFLGSVLQVEIPHSIDAQQVIQSSFIQRYDPKAHILATTAPFVPPPLLLFESALPNLWSIWECLVLCEPILVFGMSPAQTSQAIWWLRDLMRPIPLAGDIRPYFTMQDSDSAQLVNKLPPKAGLILGVTNPFFEKSCVHWPHILSLGRRTSTSNSLKQNTPSLGTPAGPPPGWKTRTHRRYISKDRALLKHLETAIKGDDQARMEASLALRRHFCSRSTQLITPVARYLNSLIPSPSEVQRVRQTLGYPPSPATLPFPSPSHLSLPSSSTSPSLSASTSQSSLPSSSSSNSNSPHSLPQTPLFGTSGSSNSASALAFMATQGKKMEKASTPTRSSPALRLKSFNNANFLASLKTHGSVLPFKSTSKRTEFYERWLRSPAFGAWLAQQEQIVHTVLNDLPAPPTSAASVTGRDMG